METQETFININPIGIQKSVMPLFFLDEGVLIPIGTGFVISSDGLMMTATHVLQEVEKRIGFKTNMSRDYRNGIGFYALYLGTEVHPKNSNAYRSFLMGISRTWYSNEFDVGYCWLNQLPENGPPVRLPKLRLSPGLPKCGENICGYGFYSMEANIKERQANGNIPIDYEYGLAKSFGKIIEVHPVQRDKSMLPFPCFRTDAQFDHGMSGGPILNKSGDVCGVICSSIPNTENAGHTSYGSLIWRALALSIDFTHIKQDFRRSIMIYDLMRMGYIQSDETISHVRPALDEGGKRNVAIFNPAKLS